MLFLLEFVLDLEDFHVDHFIFLYFSDQFFLCKGKVLVHLLEFIFQLMQLLAVITAEEASAKVATLG